LLEVDEQLPYFSEGKGAACLLYVPCLLNGVKLIGFADVGFFSRIKYYSSISFMI